jgi:hypothetical protein
MAGQNRYFSGGLSKAFESEWSTGTSDKCVFISHKSEDTDFARKIGRALKELQIDIWLDIDDKHTQQANDLDDDKKLAEAIERGLIHSTHLLALLSPRTQGSWWVPYEIGSARGMEKQLVFLVHKQVKELPAYLHFGKKLLDQNDFYKWATTISTTKLLTETFGSLQKSMNELGDILQPIRIN